MPRVQVEFLIENGKALKDVSPKEEFKQGEFELESHQGVHIAQSMEALQCVYHNLQPRLRSAKQGNRISHVKPKHKAEAGAG
jgi:hypothetical protein